MINDTIGVDISKDRLDAHSVSDCVILGSSPTRPIKSALSP